MSLFDAASHPRHHIGESLLPGSLAILSRLGIGREELQRRFQPKCGARFFDPATGQFASFAFDPPTGEPPSYQALRADLDLLMLEQARAAGVAIFENSPVTDVDEDAGTFAVQPAGRAYSARFLMDATGRRAMIASKRKTRTPLPDFGRLAIYNYFNNLAPHDERDADFITMYTFVDRTGNKAGGWWWLIPLADGRTSVGVVMQKNAVVPGLAGEEQFRAQWEKIPRLAGRLKHAVATDPFRTESDYSFRVSEKVGPRFVLIGDASGFLDPIFSSGVHLALTSAQAAAEGVTEFLRHGNRQSLDAYQQHMDEGFEVFSAFVQRYYNGGLLDLFFQPNQPEMYRKAIISILAGNVWDADNPVIKMLRDT